MAEGMIFWPGERRQSKEHDELEKGANVN